MGIILRRLSKMQASTFLAAFLFISVFWCQANADNHEDEDEDDVHLHFHLTQDDQGDDVTLPPPTTTWADDDSMTYNRVYRDDAPWKQWSLAGNSRDPCSAIVCLPKVINNNGRRNNRGFGSGLQSDDGRNFVSGCCSNSISLVGNVNGNVGR